MYTNKQRLLLYALLFVVSLPSWSKTVIIDANQGTQNQLNQVEAGDTVLMSPGDHDDVDIHDLRGTECNPTIFMSQDPNDPAVFSGNIPGHPAVDVEDCSYLVFENIVATAGITGIDIKLSDHVIIRECEIMYTGQAGLKIRYRSTWVDFVDSKIHHTGRTNPEYGEGIYLGTAKAKGWEPWNPTAGGDAQDTCSHIWIANNEIYECGNGEGIDFKSDFKYVTIKGNHLHDIFPGYEGKQANEAAISVAGGRDNPNEPAEFWIEENLIEDIDWGFGDQNADQVHAAGIVTFGGGHYILNNTVGDAPEGGIRYKDLYYRAGWMDEPHFIYSFGNNVNNTVGPNYTGPGDLAPFLHEEHPGFNNPNSQQTWCGETVTPEPSGTIIYADQPTQAQIDAASPGDTLLFEPGTHDKISLSGIIATECAPLVLMSLDPNDPAKIYEASIDGGKGVHVFESKYIVIDNVIVEGALYGMDIQHSEYIIVKNCEIMNTGQEGTKTRDRSRHIDWINNKIHDTGTRPNFSGYGECMYIGTGSYANSMFSDADSTAFVWIENNEVYNCGNGEAVELKPWVRNSTVKGNTIYNIVPGTSYQTNEGALVVWGSGDKPSNNWIENNSIDNVTWGETGGAGLVSFGGGNYLFNNTIGDCEEAAIYFNGYNDNGHYVYDYGNTINNTTGNDYKGNLSGLIQADPGISNPHSAQSWCGNPIVICPSVDLGDDFDWCDETTHTLTATSNNPDYSYAWLVDGQSVNEASSTLEVTGPGEYAVTVSADDCDDVSDVIMISADLLPEVTGDVICTEGEATLSAVGTGDIFWFADMSGGDPIETGDTYMPTISSSTTFYVQSGSSSESMNTGHTGFGRVWADANYDRKLKFVVEQTLTIDYVTFEASGAQTVNVRILESDNATLVEEFSKDVAGGVDQIALGIELQPGTYFMDGAGTTGSLYLDDQDVVHADYAIDGLISYGTEPEWESTSNPRWRYFYNWQISVGSACTRVPVEAVIDPSAGHCQVTSTSELSTFEVYPNPTNGVVYLSEVTEFVITDILGAVMLSGESKEIDLSSLSNGTYLIQVGDKIERVIKE